MGNINHNKCKYIKLYLNIFSKFSFFLTEKLNLDEGEVWFSERIDGTVFIFEYDGDNMLPLILLDGDGDRLFLVIENGEGSDIFSIILIGDGVTDTFSIIIIEGGVTEIFSIILIGDGVIDIFISSEYDEMDVSFIIL